MADGFERMVDESLAFFAELEANNDRGWFEDRKKRHAEEVRKPAELFAGLLAEDIARITGVAHKSKVFRIHRDVRFSKDKTPYNTHLHILWSAPDGDALSPAWFYGLSGAYHVTGMGLMTLQGEAMTRFRAFVDRDGDALAAALKTVGQTAGVTLSDWGPEPLKRVPKPYDQDHPHGDLLRRKGLTVSAPMPEDWRTGGLVRAVTGRIEALMPLWTVLCQVESTPGQK